MEQRGMNERVQKLREKSVTTQPYIDMERAKIMTETYKQFEGVLSVPELRGQALKDYCEQKSLYIGEGELIVGEKGASPQGAPTFPELCCHSMEDMHVMNDRDLINFSVDEAGFALQEAEIIPYWQNRTIRKKILDHMTPEWKASYEAGIFTEFMEQRGPGHTVCGNRIYSEGFGKRIERIENAIVALDFHHDPEALAKEHELKGMKLACEAIIALGKRYAAYAADLAEQETDEKRKAELQQISENCRVVPEHAPKTFWQAIQMYWFVHICVTGELNNWDAFSPGRLDQHLIPFYRKDTEDGVLDREKALELLECLWVKFNNQPAPPKVGITLKESSTYTDFVNINTGGITPDGENGVNEVSYLILDCMDDMRLLQPSSNVQISRKTPKKFLKRACEISRQGWGQPAFYNTEAIVMELVNAGKTIADARLGGTSGCVETGAFGNEAYILNGYFNLPKILEITLHNGFDPVGGKQLGLKTGEVADYHSYEELEKAYFAQVEYFLDIKVRGTNVIEQIYAKNMPVPLLSSITNDCIAKGMDYNAGGARYNTSYIQGVGIGTITDCLSAIKYNVYDEKRFDMKQLMKALADDFEGHDEIYHWVHDASPKYGNDDDYADDIMKKVFSYFRDSVTGRPNTKGGHFRIDMLPTTCHVYFGEVMLASANGRHAHMPVSEGISPEKGADIYGPTSVIKSAAKMDHLTTGGTLLNQKFTPKTVEGDTGLEQMANLIRSYFAMDGHHIQFNVVGRYTLIEAQKHPEENKDLIVRVAGYSDYFRNLSKALQDEIIMRTEQDFN